MNEAIIFSPQGRNFMNAIANAKSCPECEDGWTCEEHIGTPWPHDDCAGPGMPCRNGCLGVDSQGEPLKSEENVEP